LPDWIQERLAEDEKSVCVFERLKVAASSWPLLLLLVLCSAYAFAYAVRITFG